MTDRLQKILSARGVCSRREAEKWIGDGRITVNGVTAQLGQTADPEIDTIEIDGQPLRQKDDHVYLMLHKPRGYVTTLSDEKGRPTAVSLVKDCGVRVYPVGRLDMDSEGLLIFTNDGEFANRLMHPKHEVQKTYEVWVTGYAPGRETALTKPMELDGHPLRTPQVRLVSASGEKAKLQVTIHEGRNRQVRRMCQNVGMTVTRLRRIREGGLRLGSLQEGAWRYLSPEEVSALEK